MMRSPCSEVRPGCCHASKQFHRISCAPWLVVVLFSCRNVYAADGPTAGGKSLIDILMQGMEFTGLIIALMSLAAATLIVLHFWTIRKLTIVPDAEVEEMRALIEARKFKECIERVRVSKTMFGDVLAAGLRHGRHGFDAMIQAAEERAGAWSSRLFRRVEYLNIIGNLGPLMGLLGTVLGMIKAFAKMQETHGAYKPEDLAGGISLALVNTFMGLSVAIVALFFFGVCRNRVDALTIAAHAAALDLLEYFRPATGQTDVIAAKHEAPASRPELAAPRPAAGTPEVAARR